MDKNSDLVPVNVNEIISGLSSSDIAVLIVSIVIAVVAIRLVSRFRSAIVAEIEEAKSSITSENRSLLKAVTDNLSPRIVHCSSEVDVAREANAMIEAAIAAKSSKNYQGGEHASSNIETPFITFYGAADLGSPQTEGLTDEDLTHFKKFNTLLGEAVDDDVRVRRHINLFSDVELQKRTEEARGQYVSWLVSRFDFVYSNPSFELIDNPRVPQWGASFSSLITNDAILEIKANGLSGIAIYNPLISRSVRESLKRARKLASSDRIAVIKSSDQKSVQYFFNSILHAAKACDLNIKEVDDKKQPVFFEKGSHFERMLDVIGENG